MVRYLSQCWREFVPKRRDSYIAMKRSANFDDEVTEGRSSVRAEEKSVEEEEEDWIVNRDRRAERIEVCYTCM